MTDYNQRDYIELALGTPPQITRTEFAELVTESVETSIESCRTAPPNNVILKFDVNPAPVLGRWNQLVVPRNKNRNPFRQEIDAAGHFQLADGEPKHVLIFKAE